jgi:hypothetical protein
MGTFEPATAEEPRALDPTDETKQDEVREVVRREVDERGVRAVARELDVPRHSLTSYLAGRAARGNRWLITCMAMRRYGGRR